MVTVIQIFAVASLVSAIVAIAGKVPATVPALLLLVFACLMVWPK
jgi:hypothetical protein